MGSTYAMGKSFIKFGLFFQEVSFIINTRSPPSERNSMPDA